MSEAVMQRLKISREGVILIKSFEGFRPRAIRRDNGQWVIGYGHTASAREGASVSEADAELLLQYDLIPIARALNQGVAASLNQHQFDALASFAYSVGIERFQGSNVLSRLNAGFEGEAADALVGWPEPVLPETSLRRRAAERALFVADPASPVALSDLLVAPLFAPPASAAEPEPVTATTAPVEADANAAIPEIAGTTPNDTNSRPSAAPAVSAMLADTAPVLRQPEGPEETLPLDTEASLEEAGQPGTDVAAPAAIAPVAAAFTYTNVQAMQRYAAYPGAIIGPLPTPVSAVPLTAPVGNDPALPAASNDAPSSEALRVADETVSTVEGLRTPAADLSASNDVNAAAEPVVETPTPVPAPTATPTDLSAPWGAAPVAHPVMPAPVESEVLFSELAPSTPVAPVAVAEPWPAITAASEPRTDGELVLTAPAQGDVFAAPRMAWPQDDRPSDEAQPLFEDDGSLRLAAGNIIRHEPFQDTAPASIPWGELGAYGLMAAFGLVSFGMSMAAFRRASQTPSDGDGTTLIAIVLAVIGAACVGVAAYNLYRRWGRADDQQPTV